jgi:8-oxo-dGTP diphosphatase
MGGSVPLAPGERGDPQVAGGRNSTIRREDALHPIYLRTLCFIRDGDRVLLVRRRKPPNEGLYNAPGGKIESHEDPYEAVLREVHEESGLRVRGPRLRAVITVITQTTSAQWLLFVFVAERPADPPEPVATDEGDLRWVPLTEISTLPVVSDIPLMLPYLFGPGGGVLMGKIHCDNDDADSMLAYEFRIS